MRLENLVFILLRMWKGCGYAGRVIYTKTIYETCSDGLGIAFGLLKPMVLGQRLERAGDCVLQFCGSKRLRQARKQCCVLFSGCVGIRGDKENGDPTVGADLPGSFDAVHWSVKANIHQHQVGFQLSSPGNCFFTSRCRANDGITKPLKPNLQIEPNDRLVFHNENARIHDYRILAVYGDLREYNCDTRTAAALKVNLAPELPSEYGHEFESQRGSGIKVEVGRHADTIVGDF